MYKSEVIDKDNVEKRILTRLIVLWRKKRERGSSMTELS